MGGIMLIAFSSLIAVIELSKVSMLVFVWTIITGTWLFIIAMITAAITGERGLSGDGSVANKFVYVSYMLASVSTLIGCVILMAGLVLAL